MPEKPQDPKLVATTSPQPPRSYAIPGGPFAKDLGKINVHRLSEIVRGSADDTVR